MERSEIDKGGIALPIVWGYMDLNGKDVGRNRLRASMGIGR